MKPLLLDTPALLWQLARFQARIEIHSTAC